MIGNNTKITRQKFGVSTLIFLELFGVVLISFGLWFINKTKIDPTWIRTQAEVVDIKTSQDNHGATMFSPVLRYSVNGENYQFTRSWSSSDYPTIGTKEKIAYNPNVPSEAKAVEGIQGLAVLLLLVVAGTVCVIMAPILFVKSLKRSKIIKNLIQTGEKLSGVLVRVKSVGGPGARGNHYKIIVSATDKTGITKEYISDPTSTLADLTGVDFNNNSIPVDVYVNPIDSQQYYVDIVSIPDLMPLYS